MLARRWSASIALLLIVVSTVVAGCTVRYIADYDEQVELGITGLHEQVELVLIRVEADGDASAYSEYVEQYQAIRLALAALELRVDAKTKNKLSIDQIQLLRQNLEDMEQTHKGGDMNAEMAVIMRRIVRQQFVAILTLELAKKRGESVSTARSSLQTSR